MTLEEIRQSCLKQIELHRGDPDAQVGFVIRGRWGKSDYRRLWPKGPRGEIVSELPGNRIYVMFNAYEVLKAVEAVMENAND